MSDPQPITVARDSGTECAHAGSLDGMVIYPEQFPLVKTETGTRCPGLGEWFQSQCRTPEWRAALTVWEKYKRKMSLDHHHLVQLREYIIGFSGQRTAAGKPPSKEFLIQEASAYCKRTWMANNRKT